MTPGLGDERRLFHEHLRGDVLTITELGVASNADKDSKASCDIASHIAQAVGPVKVGKKAKGQAAGRQFEAITHSFIKRAFPLFVHLRPGRWHVQHIHARDGVKEIARFDQYRHILAIATAARKNRDLAVALGNDYVIAPDIVVYRDPLADDDINSLAQIVDPSVATLSPMRQAESGAPLLHASVSCKWTIRSDRSQNARSEGLNLIRNRKGRAPHIAVVTGEPLPSRIASIAMGTGDIDCVYHFALRELGDAVAAVADAKAKDLLAMMVEGRRLRDISDLPLDLIA